MRSRSVLSWVGAVGGLAAVAAAWLMLAPIGFGGSTGYALVVGSSMEPRIQRGDLVLVRQSAGYGVGDVVAYRSAVLGRTVLHRIVLRGDLVLVRQSAGYGVGDVVASRSAVLGRTVLHR